MEHFVAVFSYGGGSGNSYNSLGGAVEAGDSAVIVNRENTVGDRIQDDLEKAEVSYFVVHDDFYYNVLCSNNETYSKTV